MTFRAAGHQKTNHTSLPELLLRKTGRTQHPHSFLLGISWKNEPKRVRPGTSARDSLVGDQAKMVPGPQAPPEAPPRGSHIATQNRGLSHLPPLSLAPLSQGSAPVGSPWVTGWLPDSSPRFQSGPPKPSSLVWHSTWQHWTAPSRVPPPGPSPAPPALLAIPSFEESRTAICLPIPASGAQQEPLAVA